MSKVVLDVDIANWRTHLFGLTQDRWNSLRDQSYWITGAGTGFGRSIACALAGAGAHVFITGRRFDKLQETMKEMQALEISTARCHAIVADITDQKQLLRACQRVESISPGLNGVINNAALPNRPGTTSPLREDPKDYWERLLATNVTAAWLLTRTIFPHMLKSGLVRVLFITSEAGWAATPGKGPYNVSKAALNSLSHSMAQEYARDFPALDIQINALAAGEARTEMNCHSTRSPYSIVSMVFLLLSQPKGGPNGCFFTMDGRSLGFGQTGPYGKPLLETQQPQLKLLKPNKPDGRRFFIHQCLSYDSSPEDQRCLTALSRFLEPLAPNLAFYGAGRLCRYIFEQMPHLARKVRCIVDDDPSKQGTNIAEVPVVPLSGLTKSDRSVFLCSTRALSLFNMQKVLKNLCGRHLEWFALGIIESLDPSAIPQRAWRKPIPSIYPIDIPPIKFEPGKDFILMELPPRYMPMMPNGVGYVHNILKTTDIDFQTMDLNIIFYHRYHTRRILDGEGKGPWSSGQDGEGDPWDILNIEQWNQLETIEHFRGDIGEVIEALVKARPKILGISLNGNNHLVAEEVIRGVRARHPEMIVVVGGYDCINHQIAEKRLGLYHYMVIGEAELTLPPLVKELVAGRRPKDLPGIVSRHDSPDRQWQEGPRPQDLDAVEFPKYDWTNLGLYRTYKNYASIPIAASRGCNWGKCNFCAEYLPYRKRTPQKVVDEIEWHVRRGLNHIHFNESDVNGDPANLLDICKEIIRRGLKVAIAGQLRIDRRNNLEFFRTLKAAGFAKLRFGVDGWTDHVLRLQRKGYNMRIVEQNLRDCQRAGLIASVNMVIGVPGETERDVEETISNILRLKQYIGIFETVNMLRLYVRSRYYLDPERHDIRLRGDKEDIYRKSFQDTRRSLVQRGPLHRSKGQNGAIQYYLSGLTPERNPAGRVCKVDGQRGDRKDRWQDAKVLRGGHTEIGV